MQSGYYDPIIGRLINADGLLGEVGDPLNHNMYAYCANNPVMYIDSTGKYPVPILFSFVNHVNKTNFSFKLLNDPIASLVWGNIAYTVTRADKNPNLLYSYVDYGSGSIEHGVGANIGGWLGLEGFYSTTGDIGAGIQVTPWVHAGAQIGTSGIGMKFGIDIDRTAHDVSVNIGWGTATLIGVAAIPVPGARTVAVTAAVVIFIVGWIGHGDGGYYF